MWCKRSKLATPVRIEFSKTSCHLMLLCSLTLCFLRVFPFLEAHVSTNYVFVFYSLTYNTVELRNMKCSSSDVIF